MMDTSDGLSDALWQIARASNVLLSVEFDKIPGVDDLKLHGGEDYQLVACVPEDMLLKDYTVIGEVRKGTGVQIDGKELEDKSYDHFG